jgi:hypothetical protein
MWLDVESQDVCSFLGEASPFFLAFSSFYLFLKDNMRAMLPPHPNGGRLPFMLIVTGKHQSVAARAHTEGMAWGQVQRQQKGLFFYIPTTKFWFASSCYFGDHDTYHYLQLSSVQKLYLIICKDRDDAPFIA